MPDQDGDNQELLAEMEELRIRLEEAEETLRAIQEGDVDAVVVSGPKGEQVYSLSQPLQEHLHFLQTLIDAIPNPVYYKGVNRLFLGCNRAFADYSGLTKEEIVGKTAEDLYPPDLAATYTKSDQELLDRPGVLVKEYPAIYADGSRRQVLAHEATFTNVGGAVGGILGVLLDITERKQAEEGLLRLNRLYSLLLKINEAIVRIRDFQKLSQQVCCLAVEEGMFRMAWVGMVDSETRCVKPLAHWGVEEGYLEQMHIVVGKVPAGRGVTGTCIRTGKPDICNDLANDPRMEPWREEGLKRGYRSCAAFPLKIGNRTVGVLNLYAGSPHFFSDDQVLLLESLTADLSFALEAGEQEEQRRQGEVALRRAKDELEGRVAGRTVELQQANALLTARTHDLEQRHRETSLLSQMSEVLQSCPTTEEAHRAVAKFLRQLFPVDSGALFIFGASHRLLESVATWGEKLIGGEVIDPDDCWALRLGRMHLAAESTADLRCPHVADDSLVSLCVPLMGQGEALGMLHLLTDSPAAPQLEAKKQLALIVADRVGLGLANLSLQETLRNLSVRDPLTGLFNRRYLEETLEREFLRATRQGAPIALIMLDIDHFKRYNDTYGHDAGDVVLRELGAFLQRYCRGSDVPCRYGGEEFVLTLPDCSLEITCQRAEEMRQAVKTLQVHHGHRTLEAITLSFGVAAFPEHGDNPDAVLNAADAAMYRAKQKGRDRVEVAGWDSA